jgi:methyltransferase family protein
MKSVYKLGYCAFFLTASIFGSIPEDVLKGLETLAMAKQQGWGKLYYDVLPKIIREHDYHTVVEVGVALGGHAESILTNTKISTYFGIDPYKYYDVNDSFQYEVEHYSPLGLQQNFDYLYEWVKNVRLAPFRERAQLIRAPSVEAAQRFEDGFLDCIFIDGNHQYAAVLKDLEAWYPKLREGGLILGDDYWIPSVAAAVNLFFANRGKEVLFFSSATDYKIWAIYK